MGNLTGRASSAMGSSSMELTGANNTDNARNWFWTGLTRNASHAQRHNYSLPALEEDGPAAESFEASGNAKDQTVEEEDEEIHEKEPEVKPSPETQDPEQSPISDFDRSHGVGLTRARSTTQMRDLRDQMQDLKGKISSLNRRAREDSLRRRSMQSLRTPSPFTAAENWYGGDSENRQGSPQLGNGTGSSLANDKRHSKHSNRSSKIDQDANFEASQATPDKDESFDESDFDLTPRNNVPSHIAPDDHSSTARLTETREKTLQNGSRIGFSPDGNTHAPEEPPPAQDLDVEQDSLYGDHDYHDTSPSPVGERHEDRPDAFDYETFFLHSGTGTLARKGHSRHSSHSSMYSVDTAKPIYTLNDESREISSDTDNSSAEATPRRPASRQKERNHTRRDSGESISTVATFATATEGKGSDGEGDEDEWILHRPMAGAWTSDQPSKRRPTPRNLHSPLSNHSRNGSTSSNSKRSLPFRKISPSTNGADVPIPSVPAHHFDSTPLSPSSTALAVLSREAAQLFEGDKKTVEMLVNSLSKVCARLKEGGEDNGRYEGRVWRRRLETARRELDGEMNGEAF